MTVRMRVLLQGQDAVRDLLDRMGIDAGEGSQAALEITGGVAFAESQRAVPVLHGTLQQAGFLSHAQKVGPNDVVMVLGYRGTGYTRIQHYAKRYKHSRGKRRLFLSGPARRTRNKVVTELERQLTKRIKAHPRA